MAVNAYVEPVVSLDLDAVVIIGRQEDLIRELKKKYTIRRYPNSINVKSRASSLRIQIQTDPRYQSFIGRAAHKEVLGYRLPVAAIEDILQGKIWAAQDKARRRSKRQKDLADILRLIEKKRGLISLVPFSLKEKLVP